MPSRLDELTERARRTLARAAPPAERITSVTSVTPVAPVDGMPPLPAVPSAPGVPLAPGRTASPRGSSGDTILGIDPGTATMGFGVVRERGGFAHDGPSTYEPIAYGVLTTLAGEPMEQRLLKLYDGLREVIRTYKPSHVAIEQLFFGKNVTTAVTVGQARGVALLAAAEFGLAVSEYKPAEIKHTVAGFGKADKPQMQRMVQTLLGLDSPPKPDDAADALAIALCHLRHARIRALGFR